MKKKAPKKSSNDKPIQRAVLPLKEQLLAALEDLRDRYETAESYISDAEDYCNSGRSSLHDMEIVMDDLADIIKDLD